MSIKEEYLAIQDLVDKLDFIYDKVYEAPSEKRGDAILGFINLFMSIEADQNEIKTINIIARNISIVSTEIEELNKKYNYERSEFKRIIEEI